MFSDLLQENCRLIHKTFISLTIIERGKKENCADIETHLRWIHYVHYEEKQNLEILLVKHPFSPKCNYFFWLRYRRKLICTKKRICHFYDEKHMGETFCTTNGERGQILRIV